MSVPAHFTSQKTGGDVVGLLRLCQGDELQGAEGGRQGSQSLGEHAAALRVGAVV